MLIADALSRAFLSEDRLHDEDIDCEERVVYAMEATEAMGSEMLERLKSETKTDEVSSKLREVYQRGWPAHKKQLDRDLMSYWPIKDTIRICDGVIMTNDKFIIPRSMRSVILDRLHEVHQGTCKEISVLARHVCKDPENDRKMYSMLAANAKEPKRAFETS